MLPLDLMERRDFLDTVDTEDSFLVTVEVDGLRGLGRLDVVDMLEGFLDTLEVDTRDIFLSP